MNSQNFHHYEHRLIRKNGSAPERLPGVGKDELFGRIDNLIDLLGIEEKSEPREELDKKITIVEKEEEKQTMNIKLFENQLLEYCKNEGLSSLVSKKVRKATVEEIESMKEITDKQKKEIIKLKRKISEGKEVKFNTIIEHEIAAQLLMREQVRTDILRLQEAEHRKQAREIFKQLRVRSTIWKYEQAYLFDYLDVLKKYKEHLQSHPERAKEWRNNKDIVEWEKKVNATLQRLEHIIPTMKAVYRILRSEDFLKSKRFKENDENDIKCLIEDLRNQLPTEEIVLRDKEGKEERRVKLGKDISLTDLRAIGQEFEREMRDLISDSVPFKPGKEWKERDVQTAHALYARLLRTHLYELNDDFKNTQRVPTVAEFQELRNAYNDLKKEILTYNIETARVKVDLITILSTRSAFGPEPEHFAKSNIEQTRKIIEYYKSNELRQRLIDGMEGTEEEEGELKIHTDALLDYISVVENDMNRYTGLLEHLDNAFIVNKERERALMDLKFEFTKWSYMLPEWTIGLPRFLHEDLDYAKLFGQREGLQNYREYKAFVASEEDFNKKVESVCKIKKAMSKQISDARITLEKDIDELRKLVKECPAEEHPRGSKEYDEAKQRYIELLQRIDDHATEYNVLITELWESYQRNLLYHMSRLAQNRILNTKNSPNAVVGIIISAVEGYYLLGNVRGLRRLAPGSRWLSKGVNWTVKKTVWQPGKFAVREGFRGTRYLTEAGYRGGREALRRGAAMTMSDATRAVRATEAMELANEYFSTRWYNICKTDPAKAARMRMAIIQAHNVPRGEGALWLFQKRTILKDAGFLKAEIKYLLRNGWCGRDADDIVMLLIKNGDDIPKSMGISQKAIANARKALNQMDDLAMAPARGAEGMRMGGKIAGAAALAFQAYIIYSRYEAWQEAKESVAIKQKTIETKLTEEFGFERDEKDPTKLTHKNAPNLKIRICDLNDPIAAEATARQLELYGSIAGGAILTIGVFSGNVYLMIGGAVIEIAWDATVGEWEMGQKKQFIKAAPPWLLSSISIAQTLNRSPHTLVHDLTTKELYQDMPGGIGQIERWEMRHKLLYSIMMDDLQSFAPSVKSELLAEQSSAMDVEFLEKFYREDFERFIMPFFYSKLSQHYNGEWSYRWGDTIKLKDVILSGAVPIRIEGLINEPDEINFLGRANSVIIRKYLRDAVMAYLPYLRARRALQLRQELAKVRKDGKEDREITLPNNQKVMLSDLVAACNQGFTYGVADSENPWETRRIGSLSDDELRNLAIPLDHLQSSDLSRDELYRQTAADPVMRHRMLTIYDTELTGMLDRGKVEDRYRFSINGLLELNMRQDKKFQDMKKEESEELKKIMRENLRIGESCPQEYAKELLGRHLAHFLRLRPSPFGYGRSTDLENKLFKKEKYLLPGERPVVLLRGLTQFPKGKEEIFKQLGNLSKSALEDPNAKGKYLDGVVFDTHYSDQYERVKSLRNGFFVQATFFFRDVEGNTYVLQRSLCMGPPYNRPLESADNWYRYAEFALEKENMPLLNSLANAKRSQITNEIIERSNERAKLPETSPESIPGFERADALSDALYYGERNKPLLYISAPPELKFDDPNSPEIILLNQLRSISPKDQWMDHKQNPHAVFVEFEVTDNRISALANYFNLVTPIIPTTGGEKDTMRLYPAMRCGAVIEKRNDLWREPMIGFSSRVNVRDVKSILSQSTSGDAIFETIGIDLKERISNEMEDTVLTIDESALKSEEYTKLESGQYFKRLSNDIYVLYTPRTIPDEPLVISTKSRGKPVKVSLPSGFDRFRVHFENNHKDCDYTVGNINEFIRSLKLSDQEKAEIIEYYCTPLPSVRETIERIVRLQYCEVHEGTSVIDDFVDKLIPEYEKATSKREYLKNLFLRIATHPDGWIHLDNIDKIAKEVRTDLSKGGIIHIDKGSRINVKVNPEMDRITFELLKFNKNRKIWEPDIEFKTSIGGIKKKEHFGYSIEELLKYDKFHLSVQHGAVGWELVSIPIHPLKYNYNINNPDVLFKRGVPGFAKISSKEWRRKTNENDTIELHVGRLATDGWKHSVPGVGEYVRYGSHAYLVRKRNKNGAIVKELYFGSARDFWKRLDYEIEMNKEMREKFDQLSEEEKASEKEFAKTTQFSIDELTTPSIVDDPSAPNKEFFIPLVRIVNLFPVEMQLRREYAQFMEKLEPLYRNQNTYETRETFLKKLYKELEMELSGDVISDKGELDSVIVAMGGTELEEEK